jgi:hypothetical protein
VGAWFDPNPYKVLGDDWAATFTKLELDPLVDPGPVVRDVGNWTSFDSAILSVFVYDADGHREVGSAVLVAPGLAITATHVIRDHLEEFENGPVSVICLGAIADGTAILWQVTGSTYADENDITFLELVLASAPATGITIRCFPITTRTPFEGETLHLLGFTATNIDWKDHTRSITGQLLTSAGPMTALHYPRRDSVLVPYPAIEIACGSVGGMSGGAVVDTTGHLVGIISTGLSHSDGRGPTLASWLITSLGTCVAPTWLPDETPVPIISIPEPLYIQGRERVIPQPDGGVFIDMWHRPEDLTKTIPTVARNDPCPCGSGLKFKRCHGAVNRSRK